MTQIDTHCRYCGQRKDVHQIDGELDLLSVAIREMHAVGETGWFTNPARKAEKDYHRRMAHVMAQLARVEKQMGGNTPWP